MKEAVILRVMGPLVMSIPATDHPPDDGATRTACRAGQVSLRFIVPDLYDTGELEFACATLVAASAEPSATEFTLAPGDDVRVDNLRSGERRCARVAAGGRLRIGIPSDNDDPLYVTVFRGGVIRDYGSCDVAADAPIRSEIHTMQVVEGDCARHCGHIPPDATDTSPVRRWTERGAPLRSPAEGLGLARQTPGLRRFLFLSQAALDAADPVTWAPLYFLRRPADHRPHAVLTINTVGDQAVPVNTGNAFARATGAVPFLAPDAARRFPELADYATPMALWARYDRTPDRVLIDRGVLEGLNSLHRFPANGRDDMLFDVDDLDEGRQRFGEQTLTPPLRLVRRASRVGDNGLTLDAAWQPTLTDWNGATGPTAALLNAYIVPQGTHSFALPRSSDPWKPQIYLLHTVGHWFATQGQDLYYRSHPTEHPCAERADCAFILPRPEMQ